MEDKLNGERKKLSLSSGGKLKLKNSIISKRLEKWRASQTRSVKKRPK